MSMIHELSAAVGKAVALLPADVVQAIEAAAASGWPE